MNIVYLVLVFKLTAIDGIATTTVPQVNYKQCQINASTLEKDGRVVRRAYCIVGVK